MKRWLRTLWRRDRPETGAQSCEVIGIVSSGGSYSRPDSGEYAHKKSDHGIGSVPLVAWRINGGAIETGNLVLSIPIDASEDARAAFEAQFPADTMIMARADEVPTHLYSMSLLGAAELSPANVTDEELEQTAHKIMHPPPFTHPVLGEFQPNPKLPWEYYGQTEWDGYPIKIGIGYGNGPTSDLSTLREQADRAAELIRRQVELTDKIKAIIREELYPEWRDKLRPKSETLLPLDRWEEQFKVDIVCVAEHPDIEFHLATDFHVDGYFPLVSWSPDDKLSGGWVG